MSLGGNITKAVIERNNIFHIDLAYDMEVDIKVDRILQVATLTMY